jgi:hypothetical protein
MEVIAVSGDQYLVQVSQGDIPFDGKSLLVDFERNTVFGPLPTQSVINQGYWQKPSKDDPRLQETLNRADGSGLVVQGGKGSGNFGHSGRPGAIGGSGSGGENPITLDFKLKDSNSGEESTHSIQTSLYGGYKGININVGIDVNVNGEAFKHYLQETKSVIDKLENKLDPEIFAKSLKNIYLFNESNPHDFYWAQKYNMPGFKSFMTGGNNGILMWEIEKNFDMKYATSREQLHSSITHEFGHCVGRTFDSQKAFPSEWRDYTARTGWTSSYSRETRSLAENFADSFAEKFSGYSKTVFFEDTHPQKSEFLDKLWRKVK